MNTEGHSFFQSLWPPISVACYWGLLIALVMVLMKAPGKGSGNGAGDGSGNGLAMLGASGDSTQQDAGDGELDEQENDGDQDEAEANEAPGENGEDSEDDQDSDAETAGDETEEEASDDDGTDDENSTANPGDSEENFITVKSKPAATLTNKGIKREPTPEKPPKKAPRKKQTRQATAAAAPSGTGAPAQEKQDAQGVASEEPKANGKAGDTGSVRKSASEIVNEKGFFGSGEISGNVLFIVDTSGSMSFQFQEFSRMELLKREFKKVLDGKLKELEEGMTPTGSFSIISFSNQAIPFPIKNLLSFSSKDDINLALRRVDQLVAGGGTEMKKAWKLGKRQIRKHKIETVFFLTDGEPSDGFDMRDIFSVRIPIHTISLGSHSRLLQEISKRHNGKYTEVY